METKTRRIRLSNTIQKGKDNAVADALSRIELNNNELSTNEEQPTDCDDDTDLLSVLPQIDTDEELCPDDADEMLRDIPLEDDGPNTQHTTIENPVFTLPISENPLNHFVNRLEIKRGD